MDKAQIRQRKLQERNAIDAALRAEWSVHMVDTLTQTFEYQQAERIHLFLSFGSEPLTRPLIERVWSDDKIVVVPVVHEGSPHLSHALYDATTDLNDGPYGISQPTEPHTITFQELNVSTTLVVVPLVAFNERLFRVGYGKGYYDRFLHGRRFFAFGYAFSQAFDEQFSPDSHDESLDAIVTEQGIVRKRRATETFIDISLN